MCTWKKALREIWEHTEIEVWHQVIIEGVVYPYLVSSKGDIMNMAGRVLKKQKRGQRKGNYHYVTMYTGEAPKDFLRKDVQRIVAEVFLENPEGKPEVNHDDCDHYNNHVRNLTWMTRSENEVHKRFMMAHREFEEAPAPVVITEEDIAQERREFEQRYGAVPGVAYV